VVPDDCRAASSDIQELPHSAKHNRCLIKFKRNPEFSQKIDAEQTVCTQFGRQRKHHRFHIFYLSAADLKGVKPYDRNMGKPVGRYYLHLPNRGDIQIHLTGCPLGNDCERGSGISY
jgi:hypothetical protein